MTPIPAIPEVQLRQICEHLAERSPALTGTQIGQLLQACRIEDAMQGATKRIRLFEALNRRQQQDRAGNNVGAFIEAAMSPVRFVGASDEYEVHRAGLNEVLAFSGLFLGEDGKLRISSPARTLDEASQRASELRTELTRRQVHADVLSFCRAELLQENYFHAVFEATKSVADKIRAKSGKSQDGAELVDIVFGLKAPLLAFNSLQTETERSEQTGLMNLLKGLFGTFRNTTAHAPKIKWRIDRQDAMDLLTLASLLHRRLDSAVSTRP